MKIAVLTLNPGIDRIIYLDIPTKCGSLNRAKRVVVNQGSKGANVAIMLKTLGADPDHISFTGGELGSLAESFTDRAGVRSRLVPTKAGVRLNIKVIDSDGLCTEFNERGGPVDGRELDSVISLLRGGYDIIILTGSIPQGIDPGIYRRITAEFGKDARVIVDCDGDAMRQALMARPALIKPNRRELAGIVGVDEAALADDEAVFDAARYVHNSYGCDVICTLDADGSIFVGDGGEWRVGAAKVKLRGFTGAGDTFLSAFIYRRYILGEGLPDSLCYASAAAGAKVALEGTLLPTIEQIEVHSSHISAFEHRHI